MMALLLHVGYDNEELKLSPSVILIGTLLGGRRVTISSPAKKTGSSFRTITSNFSSREKSQQ
jgi:hypothetical protein